MQALYTIVQLQQKIVAVAAVLIFLCVGAPGAVKPACNCQLSSSPSVTENCGRITISHFHIVTACIIYFERPQIFGFFQQ